MRKETMTAWGHASIGAMAEWLAAHAAIGQTVKSDAASNAPTPKAPPTLIIAASQAQAVQLCNALSYAGNPTLLPDKEILPYDWVAPPKDLIAARIRVLAAWQAGDTPCLIAHIGSLLAYLPPLSFLHRHQFSIKVGDTMARKAFMRRLENGGYARKPMVIHPGDFAIRGGVVDVFPVSSRLPFRLDLLGDEVDGIRAFTPENQRSIHAVEAIDILPGDDFLLDATERFQAAWLKHFGEAGGVESAYHRVQNIGDGSNTIGLAHYLPFFHEEPLADFWQYCPEGTRTYIAPQVAEKGAAFMDMVARQYAASKDVRPTLEPHHLYADSAHFLGARLDDARKQAAQPPAVYFHAQACANNLPAKPLPVMADKSPEALRAQITRWQAEGYKVVLALSNAAHRQQWQARLNDGNSAGDTPRTLSLPDYAAWDTLDAGEGAAIGMANIALPNGYVWGERMVLTEAELYAGGAQLQARGQSDTETHAMGNPRTARPGAGGFDTMADISGLAVGAPVVHADHGVGRYQGLQTLTSGEHAQDMLVLSYEGDNTLYVPIDDIRLLSPYVGSAEEAPLARLGAKAWRTDKAKVEQRLHDVAAELLAIQARRVQASAVAFEPPAEYPAFAAEFPYAETRDQTKAIAETLADLAAPAAMDRLVCGDVGFGKTEVALRCAFTVIKSGYQVVMLAPTTLLAHQHYQTFHARMAHWGVRIAELSRLKTASAVRQTLADAATGNIDMLIGTHRLLQPDVKLAKLGLVILDEEHRFGVKHKEQFKQLRASVDMLAMTATPIPRTLNMAFSKLRDLSIIQTPPPGRMGVQTFLHEESTALVREAITRERHRDGQIFIVHNDLKTIERRAEAIREMLPEVRVAVAHGQMPKAAMERIIDRFHAHRFDVLVASTIIENGIDIPNANTMMIERADRFGLAQLHQLRGRVGRSHHQAYCYLFVPSLEGLQPDAQRRLIAISEAASLGAGFELAVQDMEIRGVGALLGDAQKGHMDRVGFALYQQLLAEAVAKLEGRTLDITCHIDLAMSALLPEDYIADVVVRVELYQRLLSVATLDNLTDFTAELADRFGPLPVPAELWLASHELRLKLAPLGVERLEVHSQSGDDAPDSGGDALSTPASQDTFKVHLAEHHGFDIDALIAAMQAGNIAMHPTGTAFTCKARLPRDGARAEAIWAALEPLIKKTT